MYFTCIIVIKMKQSMLVYDVTVCFKPSSHKAFFSGLGLAIPKLSYVSLHQFKLCNELSHFFHVFGTIF